MLALASGLSLVAAAGALAQPALVARVIDVVGSGGALLPPVSLLVVVLLASSALGAVQQYLLQRTAEGVVLTTRRTLADRLLRLPIAEYDRRRTGDLMSRVGADTTLLRATVTSGVVLFFTAEMYDSNSARSGSMSSIFSSWIETISSYLSCVRSLISPARIFVTAWRMASRFSLRRATMP